MAGANPGFLGGGFASGFGGGKGTEEGGGGGAESTDLLRRGREFSGRAGIGVFFGDIAPEVENSGHSTS